MSMVTADWLPAHIPYDGKADVDEYFNSRVIEDGERPLIGFFRGHELCGQKLKLPEGYTAQLLHITDNGLQNVGEIEKVRVWGTDYTQLESFLDFTEVVEIGDVLVKKAPRREAVSE